VDAEPAPVPAEPAPPVLAVPDPDADRRWLRRYVRVQVRAGIFDVHDLRDLTIAAAAQRFPDPTAADEAARVALSAELDAWLTEADDWIGRTDPERLDAALAALAAAGVLVIPAAPDEADLAATVRMRGGDAGAVGYVLAGIAEALRRNELPLLTMEADGTRADAGSALSTQVQDALAAEGLLAATDRDGAGLVVPLTWRRRPPRSLTRAGTEDD
jgi:hypothetical protein